jgi:hypothetical protein
MYWRRGVVQCGLNVCQKGRESDSAYMDVLGMDGAVAKAHMN